MGGDGIVTSYCGEGLDLLLLPVPLAVFIRLHEILYRLFQDMEAGTAPSIEGISPIDGFIVAIREVITIRHGVSLHTK